MNTFTDSFGNYSFLDLEQGSYKVGIELDYGWQYTYPSQSTSSAYSIVNSNSSSGNLINLNSNVSSNISNSYSSSSSLNPNLSGDYSHIDGSGQTIVVIDTGIDLDHPFFGPDDNNDGISDRIIFSKGFSTNSSLGDDIQGHGTHVAGIAASSNANYSGVASGANIISLDVFGGGAGAEYLEDALRWCAENVDKYSIDVINMSLELIIFSGRSGSILNLSC